MKPIITYTLLLCGIFSIGFAQEKKGSLKVSVGADAAYLLRQLGNEADSSALISPYLVHLQLQAGRIILRTGLGGSYERGETSREGFADKEISSTETLAVRVGLSYALVPVGKWRVQVGVDGTFDFARDKLTIDSGFDRVSTVKQDQLWGIGPVMGIGYQFNDHLSLYTEAAVYYLQGSSQTSREFANFPSFDDRLQENAMSRLATYLPARIYVMYTF